MPILPPCRSFWSRLRKPTPGLGVSIWRPSSIRRSSNGSIEQGPSTNSVLSVNRLNRFLDNVVRISMKTILINLVLAMLTFSGCASYRVAGQVQTGRQALLINDSERALAYLQEAAENNPDYIRES